MSQIQVGDTVAIRGDKMVSYNPAYRKVVCRYLPEQLVDGKYVMHTGHGGIWMGIVEKISGDMAFVGGGWRGIEFYEKFEIVV